MNNKIAILLASVVTIANFTACMNNEENQVSSAVDTSITTSILVTTTEITTTTEATTTTEETTQKETSITEITHTITIPPAWIEDLDASIQSAEEDEDIISYTVNDEGSITFVYNDKKYKEVLAESEQAVYTYIDTVLSEGEGLMAITDITINDDNMTDVSVYVDSSTYDSQVDDIIVWGLYYQTRMYKLFREDLDFDEFSMIAHIIDNTTNEEITSTTYSQ